MCPICWAAALASFAGLSAVSLLAMAGRDKWILMLALPTLALSVLHRWGYVSLPWWCLALLIALLLGRLAFLLFGPGERSHRMIWQRARKVAKIACPRQVS
jgi:hypothetical protein